jgi:hypothetical protein
LAVELLLKGQERSWGQAMHREVLQAGGTYALRETAGACARKFADETEALSSANTILSGMKISETQGQSLVRPSNNYELVF